MIQDYHTKEDLVNEEGRIVTCQIGEWKKDELDPEGTKTAQEEEEAKRNEEAEDARKKAEEKLKKDAEDEELRKMEEAQRL